VNYRIRVPQVRCLDVDGNMLGVIPTDRARALAGQQGLDLVEISPNADPPVCRIMDFGKYRYEETKKERMARKHQHSLALKEIKFHVTVEEHDYQTKLNSMKKFLAKGHKVKISLFFRGRENVHRELGFRLLERVFKDSGDIGAVEMAPKLIGRGVFGVLAPRNTKISKPVSPRPPDASAKAVASAKAPPVQAVPQVPPAP
jgi:translation initiation factor IF-3